MRSTLRCFVRFSSAVILTSTLLACGGGGGSSGPSDPAPSPPARAPVMAPLLITSSNVGDTVGFGFNYGGLAIGLGQLAVDWSALVDGSATLSFTQACDGGGSASGTVDDRDGDRRAGVGDRVSVALSSCYLKEINETFNGTLVVTLTAPAASQQRAGVVTFIGLSRSTGTRMELGGAFRFAASTSRLSRLIHVSSDTQPLRVTFPDASKVASDEVTALDVQHETRLDTVRATTTMRFHLDSQMLGGSIDVSTATPWSAWFDTWPDAGELTMTGASGSKAGLRATPAKGRTFEVLLADAVVGEGMAQGGYLWSGAPWLPEIASLPRYATQVASETNFRNLIQPDTARLLPNGSLVWVYSRPLDPLSVTNVQFEQTSSNVGGMFSIVPAKVTIEGGMLTVMPSTQLHLAATYKLRFADGYGALRDTGGAYLTAPAFSAEVAQTVNASLVASGAPVLLGSGASLTLDASGSSAMGGPLASVRWRQLSGPPLNLGDTSVPKLTLGAAGNVNGVAIVELEVANAAGDVDRKQLSVTVAPDISNALVVGSRSGNGPMTVISNVDPAVPSAYARYYQNNSAIDVLLNPQNGGFQRFLAGLNGGQAWRTGIVYNVARGDAAASVSGLGPCPSNTTNFILLDFALDEAGQLARLALDFDNSCSETNTVGSIRYRSAIPFRP